MNKLKDYILDITSVPNIDEINSKGAANSAEESKDSNSPRKGHGKAAFQNQCYDMENFNRNKSEEKNLEKIGAIIKKFPEALFNLQFFNPYMKKFSDTTYAGIM